MNENKIDPIPEEFATLEEAGEFWDTHSAADYWDEMEEVDIEINLQRRVFLIPISQPTYNHLTHHQHAQLDPNIETVYVLQTERVADTPLGLETASVNTLSELVRQQQTQLKQYQARLAELTQRIELLETQQHPSR